MVENEKHSSPDDRLVQRCLKGDEDAWGVLIDRYKNLIYSIPLVEESRLSIVR